MPRVGSSSRTTFGLRESHLAMTTFCWLPARHLVGVLMGAGGPSTPNLRMFSSEKLRTFRREIHPERATDSKFEYAMFSLDAVLQDDSLQLAILGHED